MRCAVLTKTDMTRRTPHALARPVIVLKIMRPTGEPSRACIYIMIIFYAYSTIIVSTLCNADHISISLCNIVKSMCRMRTSRALRRIYVYISHILSRMSHIYRSLSFQIYAFALFIIYYFYRLFPIFSWKIKWRGKKNL